MFVWGGVYCFHVVRPSVRPAICPWCFGFSVSKKAMMEFGKHIDIHKMNIYYRKIRARGQFF